MMATKTTTKPTLVLDDVETPEGGISLDDLLGMSGATHPMTDGETTTIDDDLTLDPFVPEIKEPVDSRLVTGVDFSRDDPMDALIMDVGDVPKYMTIVAYGKNGTGKTTFGASGDRTLVLEIEKDGTFSVRARGSKAKKFKVKTWDDFEKIYWYLKTHAENFDILSIDTLTRLSELCLRSVVLSKKAEGADLLDKDTQMVTLPQYGTISRRMIFWLNAFNELPMHKMWLVQEGKGDENEDTEVYPDLQRKIRNYVCADATIIGRTVIRMKQTVVDGRPVDVPQYCFITKPSDKYLAKDRTNVLGNGLVNPKIDELIKKVYA